jgi:hypothetical protein
VAGLHADVAASVLSGPSLEEHADLQRNPGMLRTRWHLLYNLSVDELTLACAIRQSGELFGGHQVGQDGSHNSTPRRDMRMPGTAAVARSG